MAQDQMDSAKRKKKQSNGPVQGPPLQARVPVHLFDNFFFLQSPFDPGPWVSLEYKVKMYCFVDTCAPPACLVF